MNTGTRRCARTRVCAPICLNTCKLSTGLLGLLFGHKLSHLKFEIQVVMHLSQQTLQRRCQNINSSTSNALIALKGDLLHVTPKTHLWVIELLQTNLF